MPLVCCCYWFNDRAVRERTREKTSREARWRRLVRIHETGSRPVVRLWMTTFRFSLQRDAVLEETRDEQIRARNERFDSRAIFHTRHESASGGNFSPVGITLAVVYFGIYVVSNVRITGD